MKHMTRREVERWFAPVRKAIAEIKTGEVVMLATVDAESGEVLSEFPATSLGIGDEYTRLDFCIDGWLGALRRILPGIDVSPMESLSEKLANGQMLSMEDLDSALRVLKVATKPMMLKPWKDVKEAINQELILIAMEEAA